MYLNNYKNYFLTDRYTTYLGLSVCRVVVPSIAATEKIIALALLPLAAV